MSFKGLFIGIDRYASPNIDWLASAQRDARAMHALLTDTLGGETTLLVNEQATRNAIEKAFESIVNCNEDDFAVIYFSGHGTESHELVTYDTETWDYPRTAIPLDLLTKWFSLIPSKRLLCILDCCFSGGMGAKALQTEDRSRDVQSEESLLSQLSGEGRIIFTAAGAEEKAWENQKIQHGWMTFHLLEALQGAEEVRQEGKIGIYALLEYVTKRVIDATSKRRKKQNPTIRGTIDGEFKLPIFHPGKLYNAAFPECAPKEVTADVMSLLTYGFPEQLISSWASTIPSLNKLQLDAINQFGLFKGEDLVVSAPTSSGKTMIGELAALLGSLDRKRSFFLFPLKALVNDKHKYFVDTYSKFGIRTIRATGDTTLDEITPLMRGQYDICLMTYEKFASLILANPYLFDQIGTVVIDEVQMITDESRGVNLEFILTLLRMKKREGVDPQIICLSAVIGDTNGLERWLGARLLKRTERPVPLDEGIIKADGTYRYIDSETGEEREIALFIQPESWKGSSQDIIKPLVRKLVSEGKRVIVFRETRPITMACAEYLTHSLGLPTAQSASARLPDGDPSISSTRLRGVLQGGVGFHISDLEPEERTTIEEEFRNPESNLEVLVATTTLAMGINTPAGAVIVAGLQHPGNKPYSVAEYKNIIGRAGRLGITDKGNSFLVALTPNEEHYYWSTYVKGNPEDLYSRFLSDGTDPRSLILRVLVAMPKTVEHGLKEEEIIAFLEESFGAYQRKQTDSSWQWSKDLLKRSLDDLLRHKLIRIGTDNDFHLEELGILAGEGGTEVETIIRLIDAFSIHSDSISDPALLSATQLTVELDNVLFPINKASTQKEPTTWIGELQRQGIAYKILQAMSRYVRNQYQATLRAKKAVACLLWITDKPLLEIENALTQFGGRRDGAAGAIRSVRSRTCDLLPIVARVAEILHPELDLNDRIRKLLIRLDVGVPAPVADLASLIGTQFTRGDYLRLLSRGFCDVNNIKNISDEELLSCLRHNEDKLKILRHAIRKYEEKNQSEKPVKPILPDYEG